MIIKVSPQSTSTAPYYLDRNQGEIYLSLDFNTPPFLRGSTPKAGEKMATKAQLAEMFTLQFLNPASGSLEFAKKPIRIAANQATGMSVTLVFELYEQ